VRTRFPLTDAIVHVVAAPVVNIRARASRTSIYGVKKLKRGGKGVDYVCDVLGGAERAQPGTTGQSTRAPRAARSVAQSGLFDSSAAM